MSDAERPAPLVPPEVDLRDFGFMPLHVHRLRDSDLAALSSGDEFKAAVLLWCFSWHQVPASSLPNDDKILAARSGAGPNWRKVKALALSGFIECSDGRLYHPVIAEAAIEAWGRRDAFEHQRQETDSRQKRWRAQLAKLSALLRDAGVTPPARPTIRLLVDLCRLHVPGFVDVDVDTGVDACVDTGETRVDARETAKTRTETWTETETKKDNTRSGTAASAARVRSPADGPPGEAATAAGHLCRAMRSVGIGDSNPGHPDLLALIAAGVIEAEAVGAARAAVAKGKGFAYALGTLKRQRLEAAQTAQGLHRGPMPPPGKAPVDIAARNAEARRLLGFDTQPPLTGATDA
jgi:hypothetical protein